jgi:U3 small nucleolar ribonucleoprotein component
VSGTLDYIYREFVETNANGNLKRRDRLYSYDDEDYYGDEEEEEGGGDGSWWEDWFNKGKKKDKNKNKKKKKKPSKKRPKDDEYNVTSKLSFILWTGDSSRHDRDNDLPRGDEEAYE